MSLTLYLTVLAGAALILLLVAVSRGMDAASWRRSLVGYRLVLPAGLKAEQVMSWLSSLSALTHAPRGALLPTPPVVIEVIADREGIRHNLLVPESMQGAILASLRASLPGVRLEAIPIIPEALPATRPGLFQFATSLRLAGRHRQLAVERTETGSHGLIAALQPLHGDERLCWQWILTGAGTPEPIQQSGAQSGVTLPWWLEEQAPSDADGLRAARLKQRQPLLHATARLLVQSRRRQRTYALFGQAWGGVRLLNVPGSRLVRGFWPSWLVLRQIRGRTLPTLGWPLLLNASELGGLMPWPVGDDPLPGVPAGVTRQVPAPVDLPRHGTVVADSTYPGLNQPLAMAARDRLMHVALLGPTGTGKSTLMINMALQDAARGDGFAVLDPKADMAADLLARLPANRHDDVVLINPADSDRPVGFNPLANDGSEASREMAVDHVLHVFHEQWHAFWGPRTEAVLRSALLVLVNSRAADGSAFTVAELPALLTNAGFRRWTIGQPGVPHSVHEFWSWFDGLSSAERTQVVGPVMNKLTALTQRTPLRLLLGQSEGVDLGAAIAEKKILLMPLSRGLVGAETAALLSSLMVASLWQALLRRVRIEQSQRHAWWLYIDEVSEVVRLPLDLADMMAEARGLGAGLVLATQYLAQLPTKTRDALLATVRSQIVFQVEPADARLLARSFGPTLNEQDLRGLPPHEVAMRLSVNGQTSRPMTGLTRPLPEARNESEPLRARSRERYGVPRRIVEEALRMRSQPPASDHPLGQRRVRGERL